MVLYSDRLHLVTAYNSAGGRYTINIFFALGPLGIHFLIDQIWATFLTTNNVIYRSQHIMAVTHFPKKISSDQKGREKNYISSSEPLYLGYQMESLVIIH